MFRTTTTAALEKALDGISLRQASIANNLANAETPGYRPVSVSFEDALATAVQQERNGSGSSRSVVETVKARARRSSTAPGGPTALQLESEMTELAKTTVQYEALTRSITKQLRMLRSAITGGSSQ